MEGIVGIIAPFIFVICVLLIIFITKMLREKSRNELIAKAMEHGKELPPDLFKNQDRSSRKNDPLLGALVSMGAGIGIFIAFHFYFGGYTYAAFGCIPFFVGVGQLVAYFASKKKGDRDINTRE